MRVPVPRIAPPSLKVTVPVAVVGNVDAVSRTVCAHCVGFGDAVRLVVVGGRVPGNNGEKFVGEYCQSYALAHPYKGDDEPAQVPAKSTSKVIVTVLPLCVPVVPGDEPVRVDRTVHCEFPGAGPPK